MIKAIKGTKDLLPSDAPRWHYLESIVKNKFTNFNYKEIRTPVFEETSLFARSIGEATDIVGKEMYTFKDKGDNSITLKPEMTAGVVRAFIEHSLGGKQPLTKLFYISPMFRQERPQAGLIDEHYKPKPVYNRLRQLIKNEWMTNTSGTLKKDGLFAFRGFYGKYKVILKNW